jgi:hypothetical protein
MRADVGRDAVQLIEGPRPAGAGAAGMDQRFVDVEQNELRLRHGVSLRVVRCRDARS